MQNWFCSHPRSSKMPSCEVLYYFYFLLKKILRIWDWLCSEGYPAPKSISGLSRLPKANSIISKALSLKKPALPFKRYMFLLISLTQIIKVIAFTMQF